MEVGSPSRLTDRSEVFLPESSLSSVSNLPAQIPREAMPSRASPRPTGNDEPGNVVRSLVLEGGAWGALASTADAIAATGHGMYPQNGAGDERAVATMFVLNTCSPVNSH